MARETDTLLEQIRSEARLLRVYATAMRQHAKMTDAAALVAELAAGTFDTAMAGVSLLYHDRQAVVAAVGAMRGEYPIRETYCQNLLVTRATIAIDDSLMDRRVANLDCTVNDGIRSYLGAPLMVEGEVVGSLCVYDTVAREWTEEEVELISRLAESLMGVDRLHARTSD